MPKPQTMRSLMKLHKQKGLWLQEVPVPQIRPHEVLIKIHQAAICGTDKHIYEWDEWAQKTIPVPMVVGHEYYGVICEVGELVQGFSQGMRVSGEGHITCGHCRSCRSGYQHLCADTIGIGVTRQGAFAEYLALPASNVCPLPDSVSDDIASILDPLGNAVHTALEYDLVGEDVLITGAGPIGLMAVAVCKQAGARHVVISDLNDARLDLATKMGASLGVNPKKSSFKDAMNQLGMKEGFDVGLEMSGNGMALNELIANCRTNGKISLLGLYPSAPCVDLNAAIFKGLTFKGIYGRKMFETWHKMFALIESGLNIDAVITHHLPIEQFDTGFQAILKGEAIKVILHF